MNRFFTRLLIPVLLVGAGVAGAVLLVRGAETAEPEPVAEAPPAVEVTEVQPSMVAPTVRARGVVEAARTLRVQPQVGGRLVYVAPELAVGGRVTKGQTLARVDSRDYKLALESQEAALASAEAEVELERGRGRSAQREWGKYGDGSAVGRLAAREPQLAAALANVAARKVAVERAKLDLGRTTIRAPFNATITAETAEHGQVVSVGSQLATLVGTDEMWVRVAVAPDSLGHLQFPNNDGEGGSSVGIVQSLGRAGEARWEGRALRLLAELDTESRSAQLLVAVERPFEVNPKIPLLPGAFVSAEVQGTAAQRVIQVPRGLVFEGSHVWRVDDESRLSEVTLVIGWANSEFVYATGGLDAGDRVVVSEPPRPIAGMLVTVRAASPAATSAENPADALSSAAASGRARG